MKRFLTLIAAGLVASLMLGCASTGSVKIPTPAQLAQNICPIVNSDLTILSASTVLNADQKAVLNDTIIPGNQAVCAAGSAISVADLQSFNATVFPALIGLVSAVPAIPNQGDILLALVLAQPILTAVVNAIPVPVTPDPASGVVAS